MIVECGHCGAPLDIEEQRSVITCAYCAKKNRVADLKPLAPITPTDLEAPKEWKPPPTVPADSDIASTDLPPRKRSKLLVVAPLLLVLGIGGAIAHNALRGATVEDIAKMPLDRTMEQIEKDLYVSYKTDDSVRVTFRSGAAGPYEHVWYRWDDDDRSLPRSLALYVAEGSTIGPNVIPSLDESLCGGVDEDGQWDWGAIHISVDRKTGMLSLDVDPTIGGRPNPLRRRQLDVGWQILRTAAFGGPAVPDSELVAVFGGGYPLQSVAALDPAMPFRQARQDLPAKFPGAIETDPGVYQIALDHPLIRWVSLSWHNAPDAALHGVHFKTTSAYAAGRASFMACLTKAAGAPKEDFADYAKGTKRYMFLVRGSEDIGSRLELHLAEDTSPYAVRLGDRFAAAAWARLFAILDGCR